MITLSSQCWAFPFLRFAQISQATSQQNNCVIAQRLLTACKYVYALALNPFLQCTHLSGLICIKSPHRPTFISDNYLPNNSDSTSFITFRETTALVLLQDSHMNR